MKSIVALTAAALLVAACNQEPAEPEVSIYAAAVANEQRPEADREADARRKPDAVLEFLGIGPGDVVLEMWAAGGYYTELLSNVVGPDGKVIVHDNAGTIRAGGETRTDRHANGRLANTEPLIAENNELSLEPDSVDAITIILNYHDLYWSSEEWSWDRIDVPTFAAELYKGLKPGGILGVVDHRAEAGAPADTGNTLHRIDPAIVIADLEAAGFVLDGESDVLGNPGDDHAISVFDPSVRGKTDRFVLRFRKPE